LWQIPTVTAFDAELYLRLAAERLLAAGPDPYSSQEVSPLTVAAQALLAAGSIEERAVTAVLADYLLASALRGDVLGRHRLAYDVDDEQAAVATEPLESPRVVTCARDLELASGSLHVSHVRLSKRETTLAVSLRTAGSRRRSQRMMSSGGPPSVTLTDDRGTRRTAHLSGSGSDTGWEGHFQAQPGLAVATRFIEIDGERVDLAGDVALAQVWIEELPALDPALSYLWQCVTPTGHMHETPDVESAIDALVACGALSDEDPSLIGVRAVAEATGRARRFGGTSNRKKLPEPWRSALGGRNRRGPDGTIVVSASSPVFDGFAVAVGALESDEDGWRIEVEAAPGMEVFSPFAAPRARFRRLVWWAADDRRHHHLGRLSDWSGGEDWGGGTIEFETPLDPKASYVDLRATATTHRAVIRVPLEWA
jgi:hypothetical protein